jgi:phospholipase C
VPYGEQTLEEALYFEDGFKEVVGYLTEGRYLTFELFGFALTNPSSNPHGLGLVSASRATSNHESKNQRWVIHYSQGEESGIFQISSALDGRYIGVGGILLPTIQQDLAADFKVTFLGNGQGYTIQYALPDQSTHLSIHKNGKFDDKGKAENMKLGFQIFSVTYHD